MNRIRIGEIEKPLKEVSESWLVTQITQRQRDGAVCVRVTIDEDGLNIILETPGCECSGGGRPPTERERDLLDRWESRHLLDEDWSVGNLIAFLKQARLMR